MKFVDSGTHDELSKEESLFKRDIIMKISDEIYIRSYRISKKIIGIWIYISPQDIPLGRMSYWGINNIRERNVQYFRIEKNIKNKDIVEFVERTFDNRSVEEIKEIVLNLKELL